MAMAGTHRTPFEMQQVSRCKDRLVVHHEANSSESLYSPLVVMA